MTLGFRWHMCCTSVKSELIPHLSPVVCLHPALKVYSGWLRDNFICTGILCTFTATSLLHASLVLGLKFDYSTGPEACWTVSSFRSGPTSIYLRIPWTRKNTWAGVGSQRMLGKLTWISSSWQAVLNHSFPITHKSYCLLKIKCGLFFYYRSKTCF